VDLWSSGLVPSGQDKVSELLIGTNCKLHRQDIFSCGSCGLVSNNQTCWWFLWWRPVTTRFCW